MVQASQEDDTQGINEAALSLEMQNRALAALKMHPQFLVATSHYWCVPKVKLVPTTFAERLRWEEKAKAAANELLGGCHNFILVSLFIAETQQEACSGSGTIYEFALHPETLNVLHTSTSFWIS